MITERQRTMLRRYDVEAMEGSKIAGVIAMALRLKVARNCEECGGFGWGGGEQSTHLCSLCKVAGIINDDGNILGSDKCARSPLWADARRAGAPAGRGRKQ